MKIVVYTALFGDIDHLWSPCPTAMNGGDFVAFTGKPRKPTGIWWHLPGDKTAAIVEGSGALIPPTPLWQVEVVKPDIESRRMARRIKTLPHEYMPDADVWIWVDANVRLLIPPGEAVSRWLKHGDLAIFDHPVRNCLYDEAYACTQLGKGDRGKIERQAGAYAKDKMPARWGLAETKCVIRRNTPAIRKLNKAWWKEIEKHSTRDQISLPYVCYKMDMRWQTIPGRAYVPPENNKSFWFVKHRRG